MGQMVHWADAVVEYLPAGQTEQEAELSPEYLPA
jgi:hypothetical protein